MDLSRIYLAVIVFEKLPLRIDVPNNVKSKRYVDCFQILWPSHNILTLKNVPTKKLNNNKPNMI